MDRTDYMHKGGGGTHLQMKYFLRLSHDRSGLGALQDPEHEVRVPRVVDAILDFNG
jgi:hypothetical protein